MYELGYQIEVLKKTCTALSLISDLAITDAIVTSMTVMFMNVDYSIPYWFTMTDFRILPIVVITFHIAYTTSIYLGNVSWVLDYPI